ncbi:MAG: uroporphyrinogen decarboxylase family protein [Acidobacteriota bacterium]
MEMKAKERVLTALRGEEPDRVPYCELSVDRALAQKLMGWGAGTSQAYNIEENIYSPDEAQALAAHLKLDNLFYVIRAPIWAEKIAGKDGRLFYGDGLIRTKQDLALMQFADPNDPTFYAKAKSFAAQKQDRALFFITRIGIFSTMMSMGMENFCLALYDNPSLVEEVLDRYCDWTSKVAEHICDLGFDVFVSTDDMAFNTTTFFSLKVFRELVLPRYRRIRDKIKLPWIIHSDGNIAPFVDDFLDLGIAGLHPNEKGAVDIRAMKQRYGKRLCLLGNVDLNILGLQSPEDVDREVRELIRDVGPGGGYVVTSGNSLAGYLKPDNVMALSAAVQKYGRYPLQVGSVN